MPIELKTQFLIHLLSDIHIKIERCNDCDLRLLDFKYKDREVRNNHLPNSQARLVACKKSGVLGGGKYGSYMDFEKST